MNVVDYSKVLREDVTGACIPVTSLSAHNTRCGIAPIRQLRLFAAQHVVRLVVDHVSTPVQEVSTRVCFVVQSASGLGSVWTLVDPIIDEVTDVDPILVLEYHVVQDAAGVDYVHDLRKVIAWQRDFEDAEPLLENAKDSLDGLAHRLAAAHTNAYISIRISAYFTTYSYHYAIDLHCRLFLSVIQLYYRLFLSVIDLCYRPFSKNSRVWYP